MTASTPRTITKVDIRYPWMFGSGFDIAFFFLPLFFAAWCYTLTQAIGFNQQIIFSFFVLSAFGAGPIHQGATWFFYFDKRNRQYYASDPVRRRIFYFGPLLITIATIALYCTTPGKPLVNLVWMLWALQHFIQQNVGILLLYHNHNKGEAIVPRALEQKSQWAPATFFFLIFMQRVMLHGKSNTLIQAALAVALVWALVTCTGYIIELIKQVRAGAYINAPALGFWLLSVFGFLPLAFLGNNFGDAYLITTTVHWFQYIGLNYILVRNKYKHDDQIQHLPAGHPFALFFGVCFVTLAVDFALSVASKEMNFPSIVRDIAWGAGISIAMCHFFLDAFTWRFREPYQRQAVLPYLKTARQ